MNFILGRMYYLGLGVMQCYETSYKYFLHVSEWSEVNQLARYYLAVQTFYGLGIDVDPVASFAFLSHVKPSYNKKIKCYDLCENLYKIGLLLLNEYKSQIAAVEYFRAAYKLGDVDSGTELHKLYMLAPCTENLARKILVKPVEENQDAADPIFELP